ncbi:hypothetical protein D554_3490 [Bordetella holmesii 30539]|uniref:N-acetyltransferase YedL n=2 Tax=Bordetella holmesii TaxID=35814 RepID=A0ABP3BGA3_9BORD|nr:hypothetical protein D554_3490 [Bordetella holmesii 30539]EXX94216.1 hypothetical protein D559_1625 [Bordetella holmesii 1058]
MGILSDISGTEKYVVVRDPNAGLQYVYRVDYDSGNLDAVAMLDVGQDQFDGRHRTAISAMAYRLGTPDAAMKLLRGKTHWIQDNGAVLSVLLQNAASRAAGFSLRRIHRPRVQQIPAGTAVQRLPRPADDQAVPASWLAEHGGER